MSRYRGGLDFATAHVDSCVADVPGARVVRGPRMALRIRFLGSAAVWREQKKEERWDTEKKEKRKRGGKAEEISVGSHICVGNANC